MVSGVYLQSGRCGADVSTRQVSRPIDGFGSSVPGHGHVGSCPGASEGQDAVSGVVQVENWHLCWFGGKTTTQKQKMKSINIFVSE